MRGKECKGCKQEQRNRYRDNKLSFTTKHWEVSMKTTRSHSTSSEAPLSKNIQSNKMTEAHGLNRSRPRSQDTRGRKA